MFLITESIISKLWNKATLDEYIKSFRKDEKKLEDFIVYITDYRHYKKHFFAGVQKYMITIFRDEDKKEMKEDLDDLMSSIGEDVENIESFKIPERIKKESKMMEKILNFYITLVWGFRLSRWDTLFLRFFKKDMLQDMLHPWDHNKNYTLVYYGWLLTQYGKNVFYYKQTAEQVRAGKQKFILPHKSGLNKNIYSNASLLKSFDINALATLLQDLNPKDIRIYIKNKKIIEVFKSLTGKFISSIVKKTKIPFINFIYGGLAQHLESKEFLDILHTHLNTQDIYRIKESIYNLDFWMNNSLYQELIYAKINLKKDYADLAILWIFAKARETLFWFLMYLVYLQDEEKIKKISLHTELLIKIYIQDVLHIDEFYVKKITPILMVILQQYHEILKLWIELDDNKDYLRIWVENWISVVGGRSLEDIKKRITMEDVIWFTGYVKNITYYNKRLLIPQ